jgi:hypothetical protein
VLQIKGSLELAAGARADLANLVKAMKLGRFDRVEVLAQPWLHRDDVVALAQRRHELGPPLREALNLRRMAAHVSAIGSERGTVPDRLSLQWSASMFGVGVRA